MSAPALRTGLRIARRSVPRHVTAHTIRWATAAPSAPGTGHDTPPAPPPPATASSSSPDGFSGNPKVRTIVDQIANLTLLEAADLVQALKTRLNIADVPVLSGHALPQAAPAATPAPSAASQGTEEDAAPVEKAKEKTIFKVTLKAIDAAQKAKVIKEIKAAITGMNLVEAKKFVESAPQVVKDNVPKEDAEKLKKALEAAGATVELE